MLLLVDGSGWLYRAFHAVPDLRNPEGAPTGAIFGVLNMLRRLEADYKAQYRAVVFDAPGKTFRSQWYPDYKAHRPPMPADLVEQIAPLHESIRALGWPLLMVEGVEADDVIGTLAHQAQSRGIDTMIATGDKDLAQLVSDRVRLVDTMKNETLDSLGVQHKFGVSPAQIADFLALTGDASDNVPGVAKVGPKTAAKWLAQFGSLDAIMAQADAIPGAVGANLRRHLDFLPLGKRLVTIACDVPLPVSVEALLPCPSDRAALERLYTRFGFKSWLALLNGQAHQPQGEPDARTSSSAPRLPARPEPTAPDNPRAALARCSQEAYETILDRAQLLRWLEKLYASPLVALDTETTGLDPMNATLVGLSVAIAPGEAAYLPLGHSLVSAPEQLPFDWALDTLKPWIESAAHRKCGQNLKFDRHILAHHGVFLRGIAEDTLLASYLLEAEQTHDLGALAARHCGLASIAYDEVTGKGAQRLNFADVPVASAAVYAAEDADITLRVCQALNARWADVPRQEALYRELELPLADVLFAMERQGMQIEPAALAAQSAVLGQRMADCEKTAHALAGGVFNLNSPRQLGEILFDRQKLPVIKKTPGGAPSTDESVLEQLAEDYPLPRAILDYRSAAKLKNTYTDKLPRMVNPRTGRVHTRFSQAVAVTGRLTSADPNLQNIPVRTPEGRQIRAAFIAAPGYELVCADYSQIELRIMAHLSGDARLLDAFAAHEDIHRATAAEVFGLALDAVSSAQRRAAKAINFGLIYGMSAFGLAKQLHIDRQSAQATMDRYFARYPGVARYMEATRAQAKAQGFVETVLGRRLHLPDIHASNGQRRQAAERAAINAPMQGTAADIIKRAMIGVDAWLRETGSGARLVLQVHDELVLESPREQTPALLEALPRLMGDVIALAVPLTVDIGVGQNWDEAH
jgi:DNA polymerase-1